MKAVQLVILGAVAMAASPIMAFESNVGVDGSITEAHQDADIEMMIRSLEDENVTVTDTAENAPSIKSSKAPSIKSTKAPSIKSTKAPSIKSTEAPSIKSTKAPSIKSTKAPSI